MSTSRRNELTRWLVFIDQAIANAKIIGQHSDKGFQQSAAEFLAEFADARKQVEAELNEQDNS